MSSRSLKLTVDTAAIRPTEVIRPMAERGIPCLLTSRMLADLVAELGSYEAATLWLVNLATLCGKPMMVNLPTAEGSQTVLLAPRGWGTERLQGWAGGMAEGLEGMFGPAELRRMNE
jgi:hypothetical protein